MSDENYSNHPCPFLGLHDDPETSLGFPSIWNYCHHSQPIAPPVLKHQEEFCLGGKHSECPVFLTQQATPLPENLRAPFTPASGKRNLINNKLIAGLAVLGIFLGLSWRLSSQGIIAATWIEKATPTSFPTAFFTATDLSLPTTDISLPMNDEPPSTMTAISPFSTLTIPASGYTPTLYLTVTPTLTPSQLDVLIGMDYKFVIHKVSTGEDLKQYAAKYNTSVEAILAVNHGITVPVWVNTLVIIPVGFTDYAKLPSFVVYQVKQEERGVSVEDMARKLRVDPVDLKYYNGWTKPGDRPLVGQFLLVPRYDHLLQ